MITEDYLVMFWVSNADAKKFCEALLRKLEE